MVLLAGMEQKPVCRIVSGGTTPLVAGPEERLGKDFLIM